MEQSIEEKYNILSTKIADIRELIPIEWFDEKDDRAALAESVACPEYCIDWIKEYVIDISEKNSKLNILNIINHGIFDEIKNKDKIINLMVNDILTNYIVNVEDVFAYDEYPNEPMTLEYILNKYESQVKEVED